VRRQAIIDLDNAGYEISMPVHDAVLIHFKRKNFKIMRSEIKILKNIMSAAAFKVIGWNISVDVKIIRDQYFQEPEHQERWNKLYNKLLKAKDTVRYTDTLSVIRTNCPEFTHPSIKVNI
jgi:hypothetical protein